MAKRILNLDDKSKPGLNFILLFPIRFSTSANKAFSIEVEKYCKKNKIIKSVFLKQLLFTFLDVQNENDLLKKYPSIRKSIKNVSYSIFNEMGIDNREFSKWIREQSNKKLKEKLKK